MSYIENMYEERINMFKNEINEETLRTILHKTYNIQNQISLKEKNEEIDYLIEQMAKDLNIKIVKSENGIHPFVDIKKYTTHEERVKLAIKSWTGNDPFPTKENTP